MRCWEERFSAFPDYLFELETSLTAEQETFVTGYWSACLHGFSQHCFKVPLAIKVSASGTKLNSWQEFGDCTPVLKCLDILAEEHPQQVNGIGGIFIKSENPEMLCAWYDKHLGTSFGNETYSIFRWRNRTHPGKIGSTTFSFFPSNTKYFDPSSSACMVNFRVPDLSAFLNKMKAEGVRVMDHTEEFEYGKFGWILDPEGNKIELWEPGDESLFDSMV
jgi:predicted enzyme related to lactoylglutathione lyase